MAQTQLYDGSDLIDVAKPAADFCNWLTSEYRQRSKRRHLLPEALLGEPCWDILLDLAVARMEDRKVSIYSACYASGVPPTTALRWLKALNHEGLVERSPATNDRRKSYVAISAQGIEILEAHFRLHVMQG